MDPPFRKMRTRQAAHTAPSSLPIGKSPWPGGGLCSGPARALTSPSPDSEPLDAIGTRLPGPGVWQNKSVLYPGNFVSDGREGQLPRNGTLLRRCRSDRTLLNQHPVGRQAFLREGSTWLRGASWSLSWKLTLEQLTLGLGPRGQASCRISLCK